MRLRNIACACLAALASTSCFSKEPVVSTHYFRPELAALEAAEAVGGTRALRFRPVTGPIDLGNQIVWRVSATELVPDELNRWMRRPEDLLDERLRDLLFGAGGFRSSLRAGDPALDVHLVTCEGDMHVGGEAVVEVILTLTTEDATEHRTRLRVSEPLPTKDATGLATAMGEALSAAADESAEWVKARW